MIHDILPPTSTASPVRPFRLSISTLTSIDNVGNRLPATQKKSLSCVNKCFLVSTPFFHIATIL